MSAIGRKSSVRHPGVDLTGTGDVAAGDRKSPPLVIWNHRWEFDKNPAAFFEALTEVQRRGRDFRLAILGKDFKAFPQVFTEARSRFGERVVAYGHQPDKETYRAWLRRGHLVVSTAIEENFGMSVIEAIHYGCLPLLPRRLSYPEILPAEYHQRFLYDTPEDLVEKLCGLIDHCDDSALRRALSAAMGIYAWPNAVAGFDDLLEAVAGSLAREP